MTRLRTLPPRLIGILAIILTFAVTGVVFTGVFRKPFEPDTRMVTVDFERAPQLQKGDQVRLEGNVEGEISDIKPGPRREDARVTLAVERDAGPIHADASARLRFKTLLGSVFYVDVDRGTKGAGPLGGRVITTDRSSVQVEIEDVTSIVREGAITGLKTLPGETATALSNSKAPADALRTLSEIAPDAAAGVDALRGEAPGDDLPEVVRATAQTVKAIDSDNDELRTLVSGAAATLRATGRRRAEIRATIDAAPAVTFDLTSTLARLDTTLDTARGLVARLRDPAPDVAPTLARLRPTLTSTERLLQNAKPLVRQAPVTFDKLTRASRQLVPLVQGVKPGLKRIDDKVLPYLARKDPGTGKSTSVMIGGFLAGFGGSAGQQDANGHFIRFPASFGATSAYLPCSSSAVDGDAESQLACDSFNEAFANYLEYLPELGPGNPGAAGSGGR